MKRCVRQESSSIANAADNDASGSVLAGSSRRFIRRRSILRVAQHRPRRGFLDEVEVVLAKIAQHPKRPPLLMRRVRKLNTRRFPYGVIYTVSRGAIFIVAIGDLRRHPNWWK